MRARSVTSASSIAQLVEAALVQQLLLDVEEVLLGVVDEHEPRRLHRRDLAAQLRADRAAGAGDEHDLAGQVGGDALQVDVDRVAPEHVLDAHLADLAARGCRRRRRA